MSKDKNANEIITPGDTMQYKGYIREGVFYATDSDSVSFKNEEGIFEKVEMMPLIIEKDLIAYWIEECGLLEDLGYNDPCLRFIGTVREEQ